MRQLGSETKLCQPVNISQIRNRHRIRESVNEDAGNALFKHLAEKCDPLAAKAKEGKDRQGLMVSSLLGLLYLVAQYLRKYV